MRTRRSGHEHGAQRREIVAQVTAVAQVHGVAFQPLDRGGHLHAADGRLNHLLHVVDDEPLAGDGVAVDPDVDVVAPHDPFGVCAEGARHFARDPFHFLPEAIENPEVGASDLDADRCLDAGREHVDAGLDGHRPGVGQARNLDCLLQLRPQPVRRHSRPPFILRFQQDSRLDHGQRGGIGRGLGPPHLAEHVLHLGERLDRPVRLLQQLARGGDRYPGHRRRHVEQVAFPERRHELGTEPREGHERRRHHERRQPEDRQWEAQRGGAGRGCRRRPGPGASAAGARGRCARGRGSRRAPG